MSTEIPPVETIYRSSSGDWVMSGFSDVQFMELNAYSLIPRPLKPEKPFATKDRSALNKVLVGSSVGLGLGAITLDAVQDFLYDVPFVEAVEDNEIPGIDEPEEVNTSAKSTHGAVRLAIPEIKDPITVGSGNIREPTEDERKDLDKETGTVETDVGGCSAYLFFDVSGQTLLGGEANQHCEPVIGDLIYDGPQRRTGNSYDITDLYSEAVRIGTVVREDGKILNVYAPDSVIFSVVEGLDAATVAQMINEVRASEETLQALKPDHTLWVTGTAGRPGQETSYAIPVIEYNTKPYSWLDNVGQLSAAGNVAGGGLKCLIATDDGMSGAAVHIPPVNDGEKPTYVGVLYDVSASDEKLHSPWPVYEYPGGVRTLAGHTTRAESMADRLEQVHETAVRFGESTVGAGVCLVAVAR